MSLWSIEDEIEMQAMFRRWEIQHRWLVWIYVGDDGGYQGA